MHYLRHLRPMRTRVIIGASVCLALLAYVDWITGPSVSVTCFYLIPVFFLSWYGGKKVGFLVAAIHAFLWLGLDFRFQEHATPFLLGWNFAVRLITFVAVVWLVQLVRNLTGEVETLIDDKTAILKREVDLRAAGEEAIRNLASQLSVAEDAERRRLGQELHESMGQSLTLLKLRLQSLVASLPPESKEASDVQASLQILSGVIEQARTLTFELYPSMLDQLGLTTTLRHYAQQLSTHVPAQVSVTDSGPLMLVPLPITAFLFRAVKELINNALKHGHAREIVVQIRRRHNQVRVVVSDDGKGFNPEAITRPGLGLPWIRERIHSLGGTCDIESSPGTGTRITLELSVKVDEGSVERVNHGQPVAR